ncbi:MAG: CPXCG motif-containing cysteine-rich protein [Flavobacteriaceae bacterium]|nr:CPXCG motif-containing cysteine-rich protein [Flavobacteriaceae bacterium]
MLEHFFQCPYCWETISMLLDISVRTDAYIEDCEVCCRPIQISFTADSENLLEFSAGDIGQ